VRRETSSAFSGSAALRVATQGRDEQEGTGISVGGLESSSDYTLSVDTRLSPDSIVWLYIDEYDDRGRWQSYKYSVLEGAPSWKHHVVTWRTTQKTDNAKLYLLNPRVQPVTFLVDDVRLDSGRSALVFDGNERLPPETISVSTTYNTWLAVAIGLGVAAAILLAALAAAAPYNAYRFGDHATAIALGALLVPSLTEDFIYATSLVTLVWLFALGLIATVPSPDSSDDQLWPGLARTMNFSSRGPPSLRGRGGL
jgi:hypothetical protein